MTDSPTCNSARTDTDPASLARIESFCREHCRPISEICIVPLGSHWHAVIVPDFALLKRDRHPNSRELLRFAFQEVSKQLPANERSHTFSLRSAPLPRSADGEPDREQLRIEIAEHPFPSAEGPDRFDSSIADTICELIRLFRPEAICERNANLELDLGFDSLDRVLLIASIEKTFGISIPGDRAAAIFSVSDLIDEVRQRTQSSATPAAVSWSEALRTPLNDVELSFADLTLKDRTGLSFLAWGLARLLRLTCGRRFQFEVRGREWIALKPPYLMAANHCSHLDPLFLLWALPYSVARHVSFMGHTEYFGSGWKAAAAKRLKLVPVDPDTHAASGIRLSAEALRRGLIGMVFPEGERSPNGAQQRFHRGVALLAREMELPILPVAICGTWEVLPRGRDQIRTAPVQVCFGAPLRAEPGETEQNLLARLWEAVCLLRGPDARAREPIPVLTDIHWNPTR